jgi:D-alanine-D-alanine ligase
MNRSDMTTLASRSRLSAVVVGGGTNGEHDVSCSSAHDIAGAVDRRAFDVVELRLGRDGAWTRLPDGTVLTLESVVGILSAADVVVPALHGAGGEDGTFAGLLDSVGVPYVGAGVAAGAFGMDKRVTKLVAGGVGIATAAGIVVSDPYDLRLASVPLPAVIKPNSGGSSLGLSLVSTRDGLAPAVSLALRDDPLALVEVLLEGREIDVGVLELPDGTLRCSPPLEILTGDGELYDTATKYDRAPVFAIPAAVSPEAAAEMQEAAVRLFRALGCRGLARVDFFRTDSGLVLNEVNTFPGFTGHSQFPRMFQSIGIEYPDLVATLLETALRRPRRGSAHPRPSRSAAVVPLGRAS